MFLSKLTLGEDKIYNLIDEQSFNAQNTIDTYCIYCHNSSALEGDLSLESYDIKNPQNNRGVWEKVIRKLTHRQMPPSELLRPEEETYKNLVRYLETTIDHHANTSLQPGRTETFRRLTQYEYHNAIRDLLALDIDVKTLLPKDEVSHGFDHITVSDLSPTLMERYLSAAQYISQLAIARKSPESNSKIFHVPLDLTQEDHIEGLPLGTRGGTVFEHNFPVDGEYEIQLRLTRNRDEKVEGLRGQHEVDLLFDGIPVDRFIVERPRSDLSHDHVDRHLKVAIPVQAGPHTIAAAFVKKTNVLSESERQPYLARFNNDRHPRTQPALYSIAVFGPNNPVSPNSTPSRDKIFSVYPADPSEEDQFAEKIISTLMRSAYRRPITVDDLIKPMEFYQQEKEKLGFEAGIEMALRAILASPYFLFKIEQDPLGIESDTVYTISNMELASRLSFFLWSSIPDEELLDKAIQRNLSRTDELEEQVLRMLSDPKSVSLVTNFAGQWLYLRNVETTNPDLRSFLDFDQNLRQSMRRETELFFESILREDRSVLDFLQANYTYLNERLAKHYGIPHIYGSRFRRVDLTGNKERGGLLTQGSILTVTSHANRTSPVVRGMWILTNILGTPPKPPPPNIPQLQEKKASDTAVTFPTMREQMADHRNNKACASCHSVMDPLGLALENFDAIGRWRHQDEGQTIDATGTLPDGTTFDGATELQYALLKRPELFVSTFVEKLLTYALGRGLEYDDYTAIRMIVRNAEQNDYRMSSIILDIVKSVPFQMRRSQ